MIAHWILVIALTSDCRDYRCADAVAVTPVAAFATREKCLSASKLAIKTFSVSGRQVSAICVESGY